MILIIVLLLILLFYIWNKCKKCNQPKEYTFNVGEKMIVKYLPGTSESEKLKNRSLYSSGPIKECICANLEEWTLTKEVKAYGMDGSGGAMKPTPAAGQGIDTVYKNGKISNKENVEFNIGTLDTEFLNGDSTQLLKVAVLDTGIDPSFFKDSNFIEKPKDCFAPTSLDDHPKKHGTIVTQFFLNQFVKSKIKVKIVPFKVLDENKEGDLFDIVCAIYAAQKQNCDAIVASLGYFGESWSLLKEALDFTKVNNVLFFGAAGNISNDIISKIYNFLSPKEFFPATYSLINSKVFSISSIKNPAKIENNIRWCSSQNSRKKMINAYVEVNSTEASYDEHFCYFSNHLTGTSYATPIFAGQFLKRNFGNSALLTTNDKDYILTLFNENEIVNLEEYGLAIKANSYIGL